MHVNVHACSKKKWNPFGRCSQRLFSEALHATGARAVYHWDFMTFWAAGGVGGGGGGGRDWLHWECDAAFHHRCGLGWRTACGLASWHHPFSAKKWHKQSVVCCDGTRRTNKASAKPPPAASSPHSFNSCLLSGFFDVLTIIAPY